MPIFTPYLGLLLLFFNRVIPGLLTLLAAAFMSPMVVLLLPFVILTSGLLGRKVTVIPPQALQNLAFTRSTGGQALGYGSFTFEADGQARAVIDYIPWPEQLHLEIYRLLYPPEPGDSGDGGPGDGGPGDGGPGDDGPGLDFDDL